MSRDLGTSPLWDACLHADSSALSRSPVESSDAYDSGGIELCARVLKLIREEVVPSRCTSILHANTAAIAADAMEAWRLLSEVAVSRLP